MQAACNPRCKRKLDDSLSNRRVTRLVSLASSRTAKLFRSKVRHTHARARGLSEVAHFLGIANNRSQTKKKKKKRKGKKRIDGVCVTRDSRSGNLCELKLRERK